MEREEGVSDKIRLICPEHPEAPMDICRDKTVRCAECGNAKFKPVWIPRDVATPHDAE